MKSNRGDRDKLEERQVEQTLARLRGAIQPPSENELRAMARTAAAEARPLRRASDGDARGWPRRLRWSIVAVASALLIGSGLGFGLGSSVTPSGSAGTKFSGLGFLPARGWTVVQSGSVGPAGKALATAANVPLNADDDLEDAPYTTLASLPPNGIVIRAIFTTRGDPAADFKFDARTLPLDLSGAQVVAPTSDPVPSAPQLAQYRLRAGVGGYNVDTRIYYGSVPSAKIVAAAQRQLNRLVIASERVTLLARPTVLRGNALATLFGSVDNGREGEMVTIQAKDCGQRFFTGVAAATTRAGGTWTADLSRYITTTVRAVWKDAASAPVTIRQVPEIALYRRGARRFEVFISSKGQFWRKTILFQRRDSGSWRTLKSVVLTDTYSQPGRPIVATAAEFTAPVPKGSLVRAVLPLSQARPCYLAGVSKSLRT